MMHASLPHFYCVFFSGTAAAIVLYNLNLARRANHLQIPPVQPFESSPSKQPPSDSIRHATVRRRFHLLSSQGWYHWCCQHSKALKGAMNVALWVSFLLRQDSHYLINAEFPRIPDLPYMGLGLTTIFLSSAWPSETKGKVRLWSKAGRARVKKIGHAGLQQRLFS